MQSAGCARRAAPGETVTIGSKSFTESVILAEALADLAADAGAGVRHRRELGGTRVLWDALLAGEIDAYPEYVGTLREEVFAGRRLAPGDAALAAALADHGVRTSRPLGFSDGYALGMKESVAARLGVRTLSDLARHPELRLGLSHEFLDRTDGWPGLRARYGLPQTPRGLDHALSYRALDAGAVDVVDLYTTDAEIREYAVRPLDDDRRYFPDYAAVFVYRAPLESRAPRALASMRRLEGRVGQPAMVAMNALAKIGRGSESQVAADFLESAMGVRAPAPATLDEPLARRVARRTGEHLLLVAVSLAAAILIALPLGVAAARRPRGGALILGAAGVVQTIPSLALLVFMIPLLGIGFGPAVAALFLYALLPIVRNTAAGLRAVPPPLRESAEALGLGPRARLLLVELPLASPAILAGIKTAAVLDVGTATLGALVGAGGYGQPILTGIRLDDVGLILEGAVPAAALALVVQLLFAAVERAVVPAGLRLK
jgi:osmoprotectant transport system permease protein